jgi:hypothetical protein
MVILGFESARPRSPSLATKMKHPITEAHNPANPKLGTILTKLIRQLNYQAPPHDDTRPALEAAMLEYAAGSGAPYESEYAQRYFDTGLSLACVGLLYPWLQWRLLGARRILTMCVKALYPSHAFATKLHIAIYTWLASYIDDDDDGNEDLVGFQTRFQKGEPQPSALLARFAEVLQAMSTHFETIVADCIVISSLQFVTGTLLERRSEIHRMQHRREAIRWPEYFRDRSGVSEAYAYFIFPRNQCPDIGAYMQGIPDMMTYIDDANDILSYV